MGFTQLRKDYRVVRICRIRVKWCKVAWFNYAVCVLFAYASVIEFSYVPLFVLSVLTLLLMVANSYYVEVLDVEKKEG